MWELGSSRSVGNSSLMWSGVVRPPVVPEELDTRIDLRAMEGI